MYRTIIIDGDQKLRETLFLMLQKMVPFQVNVVGFSEGIKDSIELIESVKPDLIFMDIHLKGGTSFEILEQISFKKFRLIFTTACQLHAIKAFKYNALDYLLKPINPLDLKTAVDRIMVMQNKFLDHFVIDVQQDSLIKHTERLILPTQEITHVVKLTEIIRCETSGSYTTFHIADDRRIMVSKPLKDYDDILTPPNFVRVHQSHTVNLNFIVNYSKEGYLQLKDKTVIPISQRKKEIFLKWIKVR